jgi:hypothetical protein
MRSRYAGGFQSNIDLVKANWPREAALPSRILLGAMSSSRVP